MRNLKYSFFIIGTFILFQSFKPNNIDPVLALTSHPWITKEIYYKDTVLTGPNVNIRYNFRTDGTFTLNDVSSFNSIAAPVYSIATWSFDTDNNLITFNEDSLDEVRVNVVTLTSSNFTFSIPMSDPDTTFNAEFRLITSP